MAFLAGGCTSTRAGALYTMGEGGDGCLGHGNLDDGPVPRRVEGLPAGALLAAVACGEAHTVVLVAGPAGAPGAGGAGLWSWGRAGSGALGLGDGARGVVSSPARVGLEEAVVSLSCGARHTAVATSRGFAFAWGWGEHGRLGAGGEEPRWRPALVDLEAEVAAVACGAAHTLLLDREGGVHACGWNEWHQVSRGSATT